MKKSAPRRPAKPKWPTTPTPRDWLVCTAAWAMLLDPCHEERCYAEFALRELLELGFTAEARALVARMAASRCERDDVRRMSADEALIRAHVALGEHDAAVATLRELLPMARRKRSKSDRDWVIKSVFRLLAVHGVAAEPKRTFEQRIEQLEAMLDAAELTPPPRPSVPPPSAPDLAALGEAAATALDTLEAGEWNVNAHVSPVRKAVKALVDARKPAAGRRLVKAASDKLASGAFDQRDFASGKAYVELARAAGYVHGAAAARPFLVKALEVCSAKGQHILREDVIDAYTEIGDHDQALDLAMKGRSRARADMIAQLLFRAGRWRELSRVLAAVVRPEEAARVAWSMVRIALGKD